MNPAYPVMDGLLLKYCVYENKPCEWVAWITQKDNKYSYTIFLPSSINYMENFDSIAHAENACAFILYQI